MSPASPGDIAIIQLNVIEFELSVMADSGATCLTKAGR